MFRKVLVLLSSLFSLFMAYLLIYYLIKDDTSRWQVALGGILASACPLILLRLKTEPFNIPTLFGYYLFLFCSLFLGSISSFYLHYRWWDSTLHFYKGIFVGIVAISLYKQWVPARSQADVSKWILFLFVFSMAVFASVLWEIYEFVGDLTFTHTMQRGGNTDTMYDLLCGSAGGLLLSCYSLFRKQKV